MRSQGAKKKGRRNLETSQTPARGPRYRLTELACATPPPHTPQGSQPSRALSILRSTFQKNSVGQMTPRPKSSSQADVSQHSLGPHPAVPYTRSDHSCSWGFDLQLIPLTGSAGSPCCLEQSLRPCYLQTLCKSDDLKCLLVKVSKLMCSVPDALGATGGSKAESHLLLLWSTRPHRLTEHLSFQGTELRLIPQVKLSQCCRFSWDHAKVCSWEEISSYGLWS